jgi:tetratricopeptide (TPR) repeat protein
MELPGDEFIKSKNDMGRHFKIMKRSRFFWSLFSLFFLFLPHVDTQEGQERIVEEIEVVNIELVVRVYDGSTSKPVSGLRKQDFELIVNGKKRNIHGFSEERKTISISPSKKDGEKNPSSPAEPNFFVLIFNIHSCTDQVKESLDTVFQKVIRPNDRVIVFTNQRMMNETVIHDPQKTKVQVWELLQSQSVEMKKKIKRMEMEFYLFISERDMMDGPDKTIDLGYYYKERIAQIKNEFMQSYFNPGVKEYTAIANYLGEVRYKKWILIFYQTGLFPDSVKKSGDIPEASEHPDTGLLKSIGKSFINSGATVHTLLMFPPRIMGNLPEGFEYQSVTTQSEMILRDITKRTGGKVIQTTDTGKFIEKISKREDIYYVLTFEPTKEELKDKTYNIDINIQRAGSRYRLVYDNGRRSGDFIKQAGKPKEKIAVSPSKEGKATKPPTIDLNAIFYDNMGVNLADEGQYEEAVNYFTKAIRFNPENEHHYFNRGVTYLKMKQPENALADYSTALELNPGYAEAWYNRGLIFLQKEEFEKAASDFSRAIELKPNHGYSFYYRAAAFEKVGKIQNALQDYKAIKQCDPAFYSIHFTEIKDKIKKLTDRIEYE